MAALPPFLNPWPADITATDINSPCQNAVYVHKAPLGSAHVLWWPFTRETEDVPSTIILFIPGNPGLLGFYTPFLSTIYEKAGSSTTLKLAILAHSHLGHTSGLNETHTPLTSELCGLSAQVEAVIELLDTVKSTYGANAKIVLIGHSVGAWITLQILKARREIVTEVFLLFPTISHIAKTPNGRRLSWLFRPPFPRLISYLSLLTRVLPMRLFSVIFHDWPLSQLHVLLKLVNSPPCVFAALAMAHDEMIAIRDLDTLLLNEHRHRVCIYFAERDDWVGEQRETIMHEFHADPGTLRVVHGHRDIPHAFCINHGDQLASQCIDWLMSGGLI